MHQAEASKLMAEDAGRQVRGEVSGRIDQLRAATAAIEVAKTALSSAEEAYRVTAAVVQAGSGTTTDLLDAQSALTQSRLNLVRSKYQQALARVQLRRAMGS
jgi:outer membrane protein